MRTFESPRRPFDEPSERRASGLTPPTFNREGVTRQAGSRKSHESLREAFGGHLRARTVVGVSALPKKDALLTMNLTAVVNESAG